MLRLVGVSIPEISTALHVQNVMEGTKADEFCCCWVYYTADAASERSGYFLKQWICGANPMLKFTKKGMAYNLNSDSYLATQVTNKTMEVPSESGTTA